MKDDLGLSALVRTAHEYAKQKAASRKEWVVSVAAARAVNGALDALAIAAENYARAAAEVFKVDGPSAANKIGAATPRAEETATVVGGSSVGGDAESSGYPAGNLLRTAGNPASPNVIADPAMGMAVWCSVCEGTGIETDDEEQFPCTNSVRHEVD